MKRCWVHGKGNAPTDIRCNYDLVTYSYVRQWDMNDSNSPNDLINGISWLCTTNLTMITSRRTCFNQQTSLKMLTSRRAVLAGRQGTRKHVTARVSFLIPELKTIIIIIIVGHLNALRCCHRQLAAVDCAACAICLFTCIICLWLYVIFSFRFSFHAQT